VLGFNGRAPQGLHKDGVVGHGGWYVVHATVAMQPTMQNRSMPLTALLLVLAAALLHASWNIAAKHAVPLGQQIAGGVGADQRFSLLSCLMGCVLWLPAALYMGWQELPQWNAGQWAVMWASAFVHWLYFSTLMAGYRKADLTVVYPVARGSAPLLTAAVAVLVLGEQLRWLGVLGVAAVCGGVFLIAGGHRLLWPAAGTAPHSTARVHTGLRWGLATGACIACYSVIDGYAIKVLLMGPVLFDYMSNVLRVPLQALALARQSGGLFGGKLQLGSALRLQGKHALAVATLGPLAYIMVLYALQMAPLSHVAPAREVSMLFAALIGGKLLGESDRGPRMLGAVCIAVGVMALALG
jgi:drug/metabolite transporter (DMT)-like permease